VIRKVDVEGIASFHVATIEKGFTFLEQEIVGGWGEDGSFRFARNGLFNDLRFQDTSANSSEINAEERFLIGEDPMLCEVGTLGVVAELEPTETKGLGNRLNTGSDDGLDFFGIGELCRGSQQIQVSGQSRAFVEEHKSGSAE
jgi:hypothetical protein